LDVAAKFCSSACGFSEDCTADVAGDFVDGVAEDELFVAAFGAFYAQKAAAGFRYKFIPFRQGFFLLCYG
jgi:hypothetical protein